MPSPPLLDFDQLVEPIPGDNPAGEGLPFLLRKKLEEGRKEINPNAFAPDDPLRPEQPKFADWPGIEQTAKEVLTDTCKDLLVAARLTEALVKQHGFPGVRDGLRLMRRLVDECWDRVLPPIEDGDLEVRATAFNWLDDETRGARFGYTLRTVPLVRDETGAYGWQHWKESQDGSGTVTHDAFEKALWATPREYCQAAAEDLAQSLEELDGLTEVLNAKMGDVAPGLGTVRKALLDCQTLVQQIIERKGPAPGAAEEAPAAKAAAPAANGAAVAPAGPGLQSLDAANRPLTREEVYARLAEVAALLLRMEPQSPISYLVQRAVKLSRLPFPQLMKVLIRDQAILGELNRDLDLGYEEAGGGGESE